MPEERYRPRVPMFAPQTIYNPEGRRSFPSVARRSIQQHGVEIPIGGLTWLATPPREVGEIGPVQLSQLVYTSEGAFASPYSVSLWIAGVQRYIIEPNTFVVLQTPEERTGQATGGLRYEADWLVTEYDALLSEGNGHQPLRRRPNHPFPWEGFVRGYSPQQLGQLMLEKAA